MRIPCALLFLLVTKFLSAQEPSQPYDYPVKPGSENWRSLKTHKERVQACQVPEDALQKLTTSALLETCLSYPLLLDMFAFDDLKKGFEKTLGRFNGYQLLVKKTDFADALIQYYKSIDVASVDTMPVSAKRNKFLVKLSITELFFGTEHFTDQITTINDKELLTLLMDKLIIKNSLPDIYGLVGKSTLVYAIVNILNAFAPDELLKNEKLVKYKSQLYLTEIPDVNDVVLFTKNTDALKPFLQ